MHSWLSDERAVIEAIIANFIGDRSVAVIAANIIISYLFLSK